MWSERKGVGSRKDITYFGIKVEQISSPISKHIPLGCMDRSQPREIDGEFGCYSTQ